MNPIARIDARACAAHGDCIDAAPHAFARTEEEAELVLRWVPLAEVVEAALAGRLRNSILLVAVLAAYAHG